jgi:uncharacterized protein (TIGR02594 family)
MAKRDVQLVIRAKDEASRALASISSELGQLDIQQKGTAASGKSMAGTLVDLARNMAQFERVTGLVVAASNRAEAAIDGQRAAITRTAADLAAVQNQLANARGAIDKAQRNVVGARLGGGDGQKEVAALQAAQAAARDLEGQETRLTKTLSAQEAVLAEQERAFRELASNANTAEAALASFGDESSRASTKAAAAAEEATAATRKQIAAQEELKRASDAASFFGNTPRGADAEAGIRARETALADLLRAEEAQAAQLTALQARLDPLSAVEHKLAQETQFLAKAQKDGLLTIAQYDKALENLQLEAENARNAVNRSGRGEKGKVALFGLKPYELTNLGYQVNDVVTQIASGTSVMQTFAQQGGQILQLMPQIGARIIAAFKSPPILLAAAVFGTVAVAINKAGDEAERLRKVGGILDSMGDAAHMSAQELAGVVKEIENVGFSADEALDLTHSFVTQGLNTDYLIDFANTAQDLADVTGLSLPEASAKLTTAFSSGYKAIADFDDEIQALSVSEREQIRVMIESGDAAGARLLAFKAVSRELDSQAQKANGRWTNSIRTLNRAFKDLTTTLGETEFAKSFVRSMDDIVRGVEDAFTRIEDAQLAFVERRIKDLEKFRKENPQDPGTKVVTLFGEDSVDQELAKLKARREELLKQRKAAGDLRDEESAAAKKRENDILRQIRQEQQLENARTAAQRIALEGEKAYQAAIDEGHSKRVAQARREQAIERQRREEAKRAEQERKAREAGFADAIANNGRDRLVSTAQQFVGRNENRAADRNLLGDFFKAANVNVDPKITAWCAAFVNAVLATNGLPTVNQVTGGSNLTARNFLGYGSETTKPEPGDIVILKRGGGGHVGFFQGFTDKGDVRVLGGNQSDGVNTSTFKAKDVLGFRRAPSAGDVAEEQFKIEQKRLEAQKDFNEEIDAENAKRQRSTEFAQRLAGLSGEALIAEQKRQAIEEAVAEARAQALKNEVTLSKEREDAIRKTVAAEFDIAHARERANAALNDASTERDALLGRLQLAERLGDAPGIAAAEAAVKKLDDAMRQAIDRAIKLLQALGDTPENRAAITNLETQRDSIAVDARDRQAQRVAKPVSDLQAQRNALLEQARTFQDLGETAVADQLREQIKAVDAKLLKAIDTSLAFWKTQTGPEAQAAILQLENLRNQVLLAQDEFVVTAKQIQDAFGSSLVDGIDAFAQKLVETKDPLQALAVGALTFAAEFTKKLADMGIELLAFKLASKIGFKGFTEGFNSALGAGSLTAGAAALSAAGGAVATGGAAVGTGAAALGASAAALSAAAAALAAANSIGSIGGFGIAHGGGIIGQVGRSRAVSPAWFTAAVRYHSGGIAGLRPDEVPTILQRGEEVITRSDARHRLNGGASRGTGGTEPRSFSQILAIGDDEIASAMRSASGERVVLTHLERNKETLRTMLRD